MGIHFFSKVHVTPLHFHERPTLVPVFDNQRNPKIIYAFTNTGNCLFIIIITLSLFIFCFMPFWLQKASQKLFFFGESSPSLPPSALLIASGKGEVMSLSWFGYKWLSQLSCEQALSPAGFKKASCQTAEAPKAMNWRPCLTNMAERNWQQLAKNWVLTTTMSAEADSFLTSSWGDRNPSWHPETLKLKTQLSCMWILYPWKLWDNKYALH